MLKHVTILGAFTFALTAGSGAFAQDVTADTVVAKVGETEITLGELIVARTMLPPQYAQFPNAVLFEGLVDQLIQQQLLADALETVPPAVDYSLINERRALLAAELIDDITQTAVTPELLQQAYDAEFAEASVIPEMRAAHLLVETQEEADAAKARIDAGEAFADVARAVSTDVTSATGGDLGWFGMGAMVPEFEAEVLALEVGGISDPFQTQFGWHIVTLTDQRAQPIPTLEQMTPQLTGQLQEAAIVAYLDTLSAAATIERPAAGDFNPDVINQIELLD